MCMYKMKPTGEQINLVGNKRLSEIIQDAKHSLLSTLENNYKSDSAKLVEWRYSRDMCAVYIILDSTGQETALGCPTFDYYMLIQSEGKIDLSEYFEEVSDISLDSLNQWRQLSVYDATSDYSKAVDDWLTPSECIVVLRYELVASDRPGESHFGVDIYLCQHNNSLCSEKTDLFAT